MLSNAYFLAKFRFDTAENEPAKNLQNFAEFANSSPAQVGKTIVARYYNESCEEVLMQEPARSDAPVLAASSARCSLAIVAPVVQLWRFVLGRQEHTKTGSRRWKKERRMRCQKNIRKLIASGPMSKDAMKLHEQHWT